MPLNARALDLLIALVTHPGEAVDKRDLLVLVWPGVTVGEGSLRFHMASLRKALGDGLEGARYITTLPGRGYAFVAPISILRQEGDALKTVNGNSLSSNLPSRLHRMVGRAECVSNLAIQLLGSRFITVVGTGGVGKTTVAVALGHELIEEFAGSVLFVDFGALTDPKLVAPALAAMLGLSVRTDGAMPGLIAYLKDKRLLLILDNCEHLIEAAAALAEHIFLAASLVYILATSREAFRVEGEHVHLLEPLEFAPDDPAITSAAALNFPASELFIERAKASGAQITQTESEAKIVGHICRKLDGLPLAIELAAGRVGTHGLQQTASLLDQRLSLLWVGQRTAPPRQRTLQATLDWSYSLLSELERVVLRRLAVFVGYFTMHAAMAVAGADLDESSVLGAIDSLVAKSLLAPRPLGAMMRYRLLDTTRSYAVDIGIENSELIELASRHANYHRDWLNQAKDHWPTMSNATERQPYLSGLHNVRAALDWCFGRNGDTNLGIALAAAAAHFFLALSLPTECHRWSERAILALDETTSGGNDEMLLQAALGMSLMFTRGMNEVAHRALLRSLAIAEERKDGINQLRLLGPVHMFHLRMGDYKSTEIYAERSVAITSAMENPGEINLSHSLLGITNHLSGNLNEARSELEAAQQYEAGSQKINSIYLGFDHRLWSASALARTLWMQGHSMQAIERARQTITHAESLGHPVTLSIVLNWSISVFLWNGDFDAAEELIDRFLIIVEYHSLGPYFAVVRGRKAQIAIRRADPASGVEILRNCLAEFHATHYELLTTEFNISLAQGLNAVGKTREGLAIVEETMRNIELNGDFCYMPELLRVKGNLLLSSPWASESAGKRCLIKSMELSRDQGGAAWELRSAIDLAKVLCAKTEAARAKGILSAARDACLKGGRTADIENAEHLLAAL